MSHSDHPADSFAVDAPAPADSLPREDFLRVFLSQRPRMEALVQRRVGCRATAADLVQELFLRFWKRPQAPVEELGSYLLRSARNLAIDHLRGEDSRGRTLSALLPDDDAQPSPEQAVQARAELERIECALRQLPGRTRHIFLLSRVHGRTYGEIATAMELSRSAVEKHMMRALDACKASLEPAAPVTRRGAADR
ncbi:sigma-70 family RNA polymerase sigma factor [Pseudomonas sp. LA21]|uniref:RNA polymerase sigma factor n=1 Tax=unclassified Pseudomonas TaxID=196821 RepID=UPI001FB7C120|nr:sigma-70 family RNA polymerase sigma factor [Pseudomonas sp. LA21]MCJ1886394.1 sigma-70 family RNA polymerase sigma factor [Pseudomonas sp. LA21]